MVGSGRNLLKSRNNAFKYLAIEEWIKEGSQEKGVEAGNARYPYGTRQETPCSTPMTLRSAILLRRRISNDTLGKKRDH